MADEITINLRLAVLKGFLNVKHETGNVLVSMTGTVAVGGCQAISTAEVIAVGDVAAATCGWAYFRNTHATAYIDIGTGTGTFVPFVKLKAGEACVLRLGTNAPTARASTGTVDLQYMIFAD